LHKLHECYAGGALSNLEGPPYLPAHQFGAAVRRNQNKKAGPEMTTYDTTRSMPRSAAGLLANLIAALRDWNDARMTRKALERLTARELDDIGLCAGDIDMIATRTIRR
jgi:uncharacterized protein YjiS (DUF1127 family)